MVSRSDPQSSLQDRVGDFASWYHLPVLALVMVFMFWTRFRSWENFTRENGFYLAAIDSYYHWRTTVYTIEHWPNTMPYEVWTSFPDGRYVGQFGTAFDQLIATVALIVGLGNPSEEVIHMTILVMIPLLAALVAIPVYLIGKRLGGRLAGICGVILLALFPGQIYSRSLVGQHQHHIAEILFMAITILAFMYALRVAEREKPVFEQVIDRDLVGLQPTILASSLAGAALAFYQWMWPPGVVLVGILAIFFVIYLSFEYVAGRSPEHIAFVGVISMMVAGILVLAMIEEMSTSPTSFGYISPVLAFGVAAGSAFMAWLARWWDREQLHTYAYAGAVAASVILFLALLWLVLPDVFGRMVGDLQGRILPIGGSPGAETIQEARPPADYTAQAFQEFGLALWTAIIGLGALLLAPFFGAKWRAEHGLIVIWSIFMISMSMAQIRFFYYLAISVAVLNAYLIGWVINWAQLEAAIEGAKSVEGYQILVLATVAMVLVVPLMPGVAAGATVLTAQSGPHFATMQWDESLEYISGSTPEVGQYGNGDHELEYYGTYGIPAGGSFDYPPGAYGIMTWWDYGHLITVAGERIPHSNPFQSNARSSSAFLLSPSEERANLILGAIPSGESVHEMSDEELEQSIDGLTDQQQHEEIPYVMIDTDMVAGKFGAISVWSGPDMDHYIEQDEVAIGEEDVILPRMGEAYYNTTMASLYLQDASGMEHYRLVHESSQMTAIGSVAQQIEGQWQTVILNQDITRLGIPPAQLLQHPDFHLYDVREVATLKTFERVEGATITGESEADPGAQVFVTVEMNTETSDRNFTYVQDTTVQEDGSFEVTVPYATTEELGSEDGYTDTAVQANGDYSVQVIGEGFAPVETGSVDVPEPAIYDGGTITVELEEVEDEDEDEDAEDSGNENDE